MELSAWCPQLIQQHHLIRRRIDHQVLKRVWNNGRQTFLDCVNQREENLSIWKTKKRDRIDGWLAKRLKGSYKHVTERYNRRRDAPRANNITSDDAAMLLFIILAGKYLELRIQSRPSSFITARRLKVVQSSSISQLLLRRFVFVREALLLLMVQHSANPVFHRAGSCPAAPSSCWFACE